MIRMRMHGSREGNRERETGGREKRKRKSYHVIATRFINHSDYTCNSVILSSCMQVLECLYTCTCVN